MFSCCSSYKECSTQGFCVKQTQGKDCSYNSKLSEGHNFYNNAHMQRLYIIINGECYVISTRNSMNTLYKPDETATLELKDELDRLGIKYIEQYEFRLCHAEQTSELNPAYWDIYFEVGERKYAIRNFNIRLLTRDKAHQIRAYLLRHGLNCSVVTHADGKTIAKIRNMQNTEKSTSSKVVKTNNTSEKQIEKSQNKPIDLPRGFAINSNKDSRLKLNHVIAKKGAVEVLENQIDMFGLLYGS